MTRNLECGTINGAGKKGGEDEYREGSPLSIIVGNDRVLFWLRADSPGDLSVS